MVEQLEKDMIAAMKAGEKEKLTEHRSSGSSIKFWIPTNSLFPYM